MRINWNRIPFGKYRGRTLCHLAFLDPGYFFAAYDEDRFAGALEGQAEYVHRRATSIRIPPQPGRDLAAEYVIGRTGKFEVLQLAPADMIADGGATRSFLKPVINMKVPYLVDSRDKGGMQIMLQDLKEILFRRAHVRITEGRAAEFFENNANFLLSDNEEQRDSDDSGSVLH
jgi:hypothetical protein